MTSRTILSRSSKRNMAGAMPLLGLLVAAILWAPSAFAAQVVDVRIGHHADYTRVVFELDSYIGYQIEQHGSDLVISLDAAAQPAEITPTKGLITLLEIAHSGKNSVAYLQLDRGGLKLKEMTLANPPRIVIDVLVPQAAPAAIAAISEIEPASEAASNLSETIAAATPSVPSTPPAAETEPIAEPAPLASAFTPPPAVPSARRTETTPADTRDLAARDSETRPVAKPVRKTVNALKKPARVVTATSKPSSKKEESFLGGPTTWAAAGVGIVLLVAAGIVIKRRGSSADFDDEEFEDGLGDSNPFADLTPDSNEATPSFAEPALGTQPVAIPEESTDSMPAAADPVVSDASSDAVTAVSFDDDEATEPVPFGQVVEPLANTEPEAIATVVAEDTEATEPVPFGQPVDMGEFDDNPTLVAPIVDERKPMDPPVVPEDDLPLLHGAQIPETDPTSASAPIIDGTETDTTDALPTAGAGSVDVVLLLKEIDRRMAGIESRIDEIADGRERVERQVAAQTEELRVQRAAIARTQRAVRNMTRPEDAAATEPALRDPNAPEGPRQG